MLQMISKTELAVGSQHHGTAHLKRIAGTVAWYGGASLLAVMFMGPFFWALSSSLKSPAELYLFPPTLFPAVPRFENYLYLFTDLPFGLFFRNSMFIGVINVVAQVLCSSAVAYGFARYS